MKNPTFLNGHIYHIYNRGIEKRDIFMDDEDRSYFVHDLFVLNDTKPFFNNKRELQKEISPNKMIEAPPLSMSVSAIARECLVDIFVFELMPNHFHLMLSQRIDGGITKFMHKIGTSYTMFFNKKYDRVGPLFQGTFKSVLVEKDAHFMYLPHYIHLNILPILLKNASKQHDRGGASINAGDKLELLKNYKWSSLPDYIGGRSFPSVTERSFLLDFFGGEKGYLRSLEEWLSEDEDERDGGLSKDLLIDKEEKHCGQ